MPTEYLVKIPPVVPSVITAINGRKTAGDKFLSSVILRFASTITLAEHNTTHHTNPIHHSTYASIVSLNPHAVLHVSVTCATSVRYAIAGAPWYEISSSWLRDSFLTCLGNVKRRMRARRVKVVNKTRLKTNIIVERMPSPLNCQGRMFMIIDMIPVSMDIRNLFYA
jgi:hypothetical protein